MIQTSNQHLKNTQRNLRHSVTKRNQLKMNKHMISICFYKDNWKDDTALTCPQPKCIQNSGG